MQHLACATEVPNVGCWELRLPILLVVLGIQRVTCYSVEIFRPDTDLRELNPSLFNMCLTWTSSGRCLWAQELHRDLGLGSICRRELCAGERG